MENSEKPDMPEVEPEVDQESIKEAAITGPVTSARANRFYDRIRSRILETVEVRGARLGKAGDFLMFAPDVFMLLWRLANDPRVSGKNKVLLGTGIAYYIFPIDIVPEALLGPVGYIDDLIFGVYILNRMLADTEESILREHWSGDGDLLDMMRRVLQSADRLVATDVVEKIRKMAKQ